MKCSTKAISRNITNILKTKIKQKPSSRPPPVPRQRQPERVREREREPEPEAGPSRDAPSRLAPVSDDSCSCEHS